jgi:hypothetical protein
VVYVKRVQIKRLEKRDVCLHLCQYLIHLVNPVEREELGLE